MRKQKPVVIGIDELDRLDMTKVPRRVRRELWRAMCADLPDHDSKQKAWADEFASVADIPVTKMPNKSWVNWVVYNFKRMQRNGEVNAVKDDADKEVTE